jgi:hypothetical protein
LPRRRLIHSPGRRRNATTPLTGLAIAAEPASGVAGISARAAAGGAVNHAAPGEEGDDVVSIRRRLHVADIALPALSTVTDRQAIGTGKLPR